MTRGGGLSLWRPRPRPRRRCGDGERTYVEPDTHTVTVCVTDDDGGEGCDSFDVEVLAETSFEVDITPVAPLDEAAPPPSPSPGPGVDPHRPRRRWSLSGPSAPSRRAARPR